MKTPTDHQTQELPTLGVGNPPYVELNEYAPWPIPKKAEPKPNIERVLDEVKGWLHRVGKV